MVSPTKLDSPEADYEAELLAIEGAGILALEIPSHLTMLKDTIPEVYWDFLDVFNGQKAATNLHSPR